MTKHLSTRRKKQGVSANKADIKQSKAKAAASSASTGGRGVSFENRAQAVKLLHMCLGMPSPGIAEGWAIVELRFQARVHGPQTDDLVCTVQNSSGMQRKVLLQMKSGLTARPSHKAFQDAIEGAWIDYHQTDHFVREEDCIVIVHDARGKHNMSGASAVAKAASMSLNVIDWLEKIETEGVSNSLKRNGLAAFKTIAANFAGRSIDDEELYQFLRHVSFLSHDLEEEGTPEHVNLVNLIGTSILSTGYRADPYHVWSKLVTICMSLNADSAGVSVQTVAEKLGNDLARAFTMIRNASSIGLNFGTAPNRLARQTGNMYIPIEGPVSTALSPNNTVGQDDIPAARDGSANKLISRQLDHINSRIKVGKYKDAMCDLIKLGEDMKFFDEHQKARWYLMRGTCKWHFDRDDEAASDFLKAAELCDDDDKLAAARVRGLMLKNDSTAAFKASQDALDRFPHSLAVWLIAKNVDVLRGGIVTEQDIPFEHRNEADAFGIVAWYLHNAGEIQGAAKVARKALTLPTASFFTRDSALRYTLESVSENALNVVFHMLTPDEHNALSFVAQAFELRLEKLWAIQSESTLCPTIVNLGYAYIFLKRGQETLDLLGEARTRGIDDFGFIRLELEAYRSINRIDMAIQVGQNRVGSMPADALVTFAQIAATAGKSEPISQALEAANQLNEDRERAVESIKTLLWGTLMDAGYQDEVLTQIYAIDLAVSTSIPVLVQAAQILRRANQQERANYCVDRVAGLLTPASPQPTKYLVARALFYAQRFDECAAIYESILRSGVHSELHNDLLYCYLRLDAHAKAKKLLDLFPSDWIHEAEARNMAIQLAQDVSDWHLLRKLSIAQLTEAPECAMSWVFRLMTASRKSTAELSMVLADVPELVQGNTRELTQIATCEMSNGYEERALRRLYRMRRMNLTDVDVAAAHLAAHIMMQTQLPHLEAEMPAILPGTYFTVVDDEGRNFTRSIDPESISGLPDTGEFRSASAKEIAPFIGATVGAEIAVPQPFADPKVLKVVAIGSSYRRLLDSSHQLLKESLAQSSFMSIIDLPEDEQGNIDFSRLKAQVLKGSHFGKQIIETYRGAPLTIGSVCRLLNRSVVDAICGWPVQESKLDVGGGPVEQRITAERLLERPDAIYVIDAATIIELGRVDCLHLLAILPKLYCTTKTYDVIRDELEESKRIKSSGTAFEHEGEMAVVEFTEQDRTSRIELLQRLVEAIDTYCELRPSYGPDDWQRVPIKLKEIVSAEEFATLVLSLEVGATLLCLDARLRLLGDTCGLQGVWPQVFLGSCLGTGHISKRDYSIACVKFFLTGRNFISLDATDLLFSMYQGKTWISNIIPAFQQHISQDDVDFDSALKVVMELISRLAMIGTCQLGFFIETTGFLVEGLARHKRCPEDLAFHLKEELAASPGIRKQNENLQRYLRLVIDGAFVRARREGNPSDFKGSVLFCSNPPLLINGIAQHAIKEMLQAAVSDEIPPEEKMSNQSTSGSAISSPL